ncbi:MAG: hypothetical protein JW820_10705 [Spirochaetales bacterium]|nr:hypothetical protein [Spirochaetales bacterium]
MSDLDTFKKTIADRREEPELDYDTSDEDELRALYPSLSNLPYRNTKASREAAPTELRESQQQVNKDGAEYASDAQYPILQLARDYFQEQLDALDVPARIKHRLVDDFKRAVEQHPSKIELARTYREVVNRVLGGVGAMQRAEDRREELASLYPSMRGIF